MAQLGKINQLRVVKSLDFGCYLDGEEHGEILIPRRYVPEGTEIDDVLEVFVYFDSEDRIIASTEKPKIVLGEIASLNVVALTNAGAFLDWGLSKDILVPYREQKQKMEVGKSYIVRLYIDHETNRLAATAKVEKFLDFDPPEFEIGEEVNLLIYNKTDLGYTAIVNHSHIGVLYQNEIFQQVSQGMQVKGYIKKIREDGKIDLALQKQGYENIEDSISLVLEKLKEHGNILPVGDKSSPNEIYKLLGLSKKAFKKVIGALYKSKKIAIEAKSIRLKE